MNERTPSLKLIIGNKAYSSWSLRAWLAAKQSGLHFDELTLPLYDDSWDERRREEDLVPSSGKVPILWDGDTVVWDSMAILEYLADKVGRDRFWPKDECARGMARALCAEMHSGYLPLRRDCTMNLRKVFEGHTIGEDARNDAIRILQLWAEARSRFGSTGPYLFGTFSAADIMFAPVVTRFVTYDFTLPGFAESYVEAMLAHPWMQEWYAGANDEEWVIQKFEEPAV